MDERVENAAWQEIRVYLEQQKHEIDEEIARYPAPIPACDAQFNHLMARRAQLTRDLGRLATASKEKPAGGDALAWLDEFVRLSISPDDSTQRAMRRQVDALLAHHEI